MYSENLMFLIIQDEKQIQVQLKVMYFQMDNNISDKVLFPIIMYPKELVRGRARLKREKMMQLKKNQDNKKKEKQQNKEFFNLLATVRNDFSNVIFFDNIEFLV